jgi:hypothetical protein
MNAVLRSSILIVFFSCQGESTDLIENQAIEINHDFYIMYKDFGLIDSLQSQIYEGDTLAYEAMKEIYFLAGRSNEFLYYSLLFYEKYKYSKAKSDFQFIVRGITFNSEDKIEFPNN